jgi:hypothetical protein
MAEAKPDCNSEMRGVCPTTVRTAFPEWRDPLRASASGGRRKGPDSNSSPSGRFHAALKVLKHRAQGVPRAFRLASCASGLI